MLSSQCRSVFSHYSGQNFMNLPETALFDSSIFGFFRNHCSESLNSIGTSQRSENLTLFSYSSTFGHVPIACNFSLGWSKSPCGRPLSPPAVKILALGHNIINYNIFQMKYWHFIRSQFNDSLSRRWFRSDFNLQISHGPEAAIHDSVLRAPQKIEQRDPGETHPPMSQGCSLSAHSGYVGCSLSERENVSGRRWATRKILQ
jgi:hypothetical protein